MKLARWQHQLVVRHLVFDRIDQNVASGAKSAIYNFHVVVVVVVVINATTIYRDIVDGVCRLMDKG